MSHRTISAALVAVLNSACLGAPVSPFLETFDADNANWDGLSGPAGWNAGEITTTVADLSTGNPQSGFLLFKGEGALGSSGGAFSGDYAAGGITAVSFDIRHDATDPLTVYLRVAPAGGAGAVFLDLVPVAGGAWTTVTVSLSESNPGYILEGPPTPGALAGLLTDVQKLQIGAIAGPGATGSATFELDNVRLLPAPGTLALLGLGGIAAARRRR